MTRARSIAFVLFLVLFFLVQVVVASALGLGRMPKREAPPPNGAPAEIGVAYGVEAWCMLPMKMGGLWWAFPDGAIEPPPADIPPWPFSIWANVGDPSPVPGVLTLFSANQAVFRADSDGTEFTMTGHRQNPMGGYGCL
jgi:hypothetical protein